MKTEDNPRRHGADATTIDKASLVVGVLMGGLSAEREVSLDTGAGVLAALREKGYRCVAIDWASGTSLPRLLHQGGIDIVWNALHGYYGEDGAVQGLLECMEIPCTGSGIMASALAMDKVMSKRIFESNGLPTPRWAVLPPGADAAEMLDGWPVPFVIKPGNEGSSVGVTIVGDKSAIAAAIDLARGFHGPVLIEEYIAGAELQVGILGQEILGSIEVRPAVEFYDYQAKYKRDDTGYIIPPQLDSSLVEHSETLSLAAYQALGCTGYGRVDMRIDMPEGRPYLLEVNTLPGMTSHSLLPKIAAHAGLSYPDLCEHILTSALPPRG